MLQHITVVPFEGGADRASIPLAALACAGCKPDASKVIPVKTAVAAQHGVLSCDTLLAHTVQLWLCILLLMRWLRLGNGPRQGRLYDDHCVGLDTPHRHLLLPCWLLPCWLLPSQLLGLLLRSRSDHCPQWHPCEAEQTDETALGCVNCLQMLQGPISCCHVRCPV